MRKRLSIVLGSFVVIALWMGLAFAFHRILVVPRDTRFDFYAPWVGVRAAAQGKDPYSEEVSQLIQQSQGIVFPHPRHGGFVHPPHLIVFLLPAALVPFPVFISLWLAALFILSQFSMIIGLRLIGLAPHRVEVIVLGLTIVLYRYAMIGVTFGQPAFFVLAMLVLSVWFHRQRKNYLSGLALVAAAIKPDLSFGPILIFLAVSVYQRRFKVLWGVFGSSALLGVVVTLLLGSSWPIEYRAAVEAYTEYHLSTWVLTSPARWLWPGAWLALLFALRSLWDSLHRARWSWLAAMSVISSLILIPQSGTYNLTFLLVPVFIGWAMLSSPWRWMWLAMWWMLPWLVWSLSSDPNTDLRIVPWLMLASLVALDFCCNKSTGTSTDISHANFLPDVDLVNADRVTGKDQG
jgi:hypothetical protein